MTDQHDARDALSTEVLADLMTLHGRATPGTWAQGTSSHHTVSKREGKGDYHVANFHHADDASFIDNAHKYMPLLIEEIHRLRSATQSTKPEQQAGGVPAGLAAWENSEGWESLAWELCADENGEESCNELIWEGGPVPEPWGERWLKYEDEAKRLIKLVHKHAAAPSQSAVQPLSEAQIEEAFQEAAGADEDTHIRFARAIERAHGITQHEGVKA